MAGIDLKNIYKLHKYYIYLLTKSIKGGNNLRIFGSKLIEGLEVRVTKIIFVVIHLVGAADNAAFNFSQSTSLNFVLWTRDCSISRMVPIAREIHNVVV
jgi:hypothetical protein